MRIETMTTSERDNVTEQQIAPGRDRRGVATLAARTCRDLGVLTGIFFVSLLGFIVCTTLFAVGAGLAVTMVGLVVLVAALVVAGSFARYQRLLLSCAGIEIAEPVRPPRRRGFAGLSRRLRDPQAWRELVHVLVAFVLGTATFSIGLTWFLAGPAELTYGVWSRWLPGAATRAWRGCSVSPAT